MSRILKRYITSGQLQRTVWYVLDLVLGKFREHIVEPIQDLTTNLFDTLKRRDPIVTHDELVQSHLALSRMLDQYEHKYEEKNGVISNVLSTIYPSALSGDVKEMNTVHAPPPDTSSPKNRLTTSRELSSMERLMRDYEKELQTPIKGLLFGDLISSVLIQVRTLLILLFLLFSSVLFVL